MKKKLRLKIWIKDFIWGVLLGLVVYLIFMFGLGIWKI